MSCGVEVREGGRGEPGSGWPLEGTRHLNTSLSTTADATHLSCFQAIQQHCTLTAFYRFQSPFLFNSYTHAVVSRPNLPTDAQEVQAAWREETGPTLLLKHYPECRSVFHTT